MTLAEIEDLVLERDSLRQDLAAVVDHDRLARIATAFAVGRVSASIIDVLYRAAGRAVSLAALEARVVQGATKDRETRTALPSHIVTIRKAAGGDFIECQRLFGYSMPLAARHRVFDAICR